jgi:enoyl-CoA hydratase/carnithine racemase
MTTIAYESIALSREGQVAVLTLNRPDQLNAWDWRMHREMGHAYATLDADDDVRAIVVTGAGRAFCSGAGLVKTGATFDGTRQRTEFDDDLPGPTKHAAELLTPVIAAVNGAAVGAGLTMAMGADIRIVSEDGKLGFVFNRRGVMPDADLLWSLPRTIGYARSMDLLLTARVFRGAEAVALGLAVKALPADEVLPAAMEMAQDIATNVAPVSAAITKLVGRRAVDEIDRATVLAWQRELFAWTGRQPDAREGVTAFLERRDPEWTLKPSTDMPDELLDPILGEGWRS